MKYFKQIAKLSLCLTIGATLAMASGCNHNISKEPVTAPTPTPAEATATPVLTDEGNPIVTMSVQNYGTIQMELYPKTAPNTVNNFISLIQKGFYDGLTFHRIAPGFVIQGGDPEGTGAGGPGYRIAGEFSNNGIENNTKHLRGVISMARRQQPLDSAGSQFFIMLQNNSSLDGDYAAFGKVIEGMDVVDAIAGAELASSQTPKNPPVITKMTVDTKGVTYPAPQTLPLEED